MMETRNICREGFSSLTSFFHGTGFGLPRAFAFLVTILLTCMAVSKYHSLHSTVYDMGTFQSNLYQLSYLNTWEGAFHGHVQPFLFVWALIYKILPLDLAPYFLLTLQAILLTLPAWYLSKNYGFWGVAPFSLYFPLWFNGLFDFHVDHFAVPLLFAFFFLVEKERFNHSMIPALLLCLVKEPFALETAMCGGFLILHSKKILPGLILFFFGLTYFYVCTSILIPFISISKMSPGIGSPQFAWLGENLGQIVTTLLTQPLMVINHIFQDKAKFDFLVITFGSLGFLSFFKAVYLVPALPLIAISLLADGAYDSIEHHYTAGLIAPMIMSFIKGKETAFSFANKFPFNTNWLGLALILGLLAAHIKFSPSPISIKFWFLPGAPYHYRNYIHTDRDSWIKRAIETHIPSSPEIAVSTQNSLNWGKLPHRKYYFGFPKAVFEPSIEPDWSDGSIEKLKNFSNSGEKPYPRPKEINADYILLDLQRPWYIVDKGCFLIGGNCGDETIREEFLNQLKLSRQLFDIVFERDGFMILKRKSDANPST